MQSIRDRLVALIDELSDEDLAGIEPLLKELVLRRRMVLKDLELQAMEGGGSGRRATGDGRGVNFSGWDELWADFHWGRRR